jgi:hypothetical protein
VLSTLPATLATEVKVPAVSKKSMKNKVKTIVAIDALSSSTINQRQINESLVLGALTAPLKFS